MPRAIIHIGANKTGSTTLQRCLFAKSKDLVYLGEDCAGYEAYRETLDSLVWDDDIHFRPDAARALFHSVRSQAPDKSFVLSNEDIIRSRVPTLCAYRLRELVPDAEILLIVRNQLTAIPSWYANHGAYLKMVPRRYWRRYVSFAEWMEYCTAFLKYSPLDGFFYHRTASLYASLFGADHVHVLMYEHFVEDERKFVGELCELLGIDAQLGVDLVEGRRERRRNTMRMHRYHYFRSWFLPARRLSRGLPCGDVVAKWWWRFLQRGAPANGFLTEHWRARIAELYGEDNAALAGKYRLALGSYGYPTRKGPCSG